MDRPLVGEVMSKIVDPDKIVLGLADYYESQQALMLGKPLDIGRLFYMRIHEAAQKHPEINDYEVIWNHIHGALLGMIEVGDRVEVVKVDERRAIARRERIGVIDDAINEMLKKLGVV